MIFRKRTLYVHVQIVPVVQSRQGLSELCDHSTNKVVSDLDLQQFCYGANCTYIEQE